MADGKLNILFVEDHQALAENLSEYFSDDGYQTDFAANGLTALHLLATNKYDVVVLDIMLPGVNGHDICSRIRKDMGSIVPVLMLTALDSIDDKIEGFGVGADDYLAKPFDMRELELRIQALCRRKVTGNECLIAGDIVFDPGTLTVTDAHGEKLVLSGYSATLFEALMKAYPNFVSYELLGEILWGANADGSEHTIRTHVYILRKLLTQVFGRSLIRSLYGRGYQLGPEKK